MVGGGGGAEARSGGRGEAGAGREDAEGFLRVVEDDFDLGDFFRDLDERFRVLAAPVAIGDEPHGGAEAFIDAGAVGLGVLRADGPLRHMRCNNAVLHKTFSYNPAIHPSDLRHLPVGLSVSILIQHDTPCCTHGSRMRLVEFGAGADKIGAAVER